MEQQSFGGVDFFVSYTSADARWAEWIAWQLEADGYRVTLQAWDFLAGANFVLEMQRAAQRALRTVLVLSPGFLESKFAAPEWAAAFGSDPEGLERRVLPIRVADCRPSGLLAQVVYIDLVGLPEREAKDVLLKRVRAERLKPSREPNFPGVPKPFPVAGPASGASAVCTRFVHTQITAAGLDLLPGVNPYAAPVDPTDDRAATTVQSAWAYTWLPHTDYFRSGHIQNFTPMAAFCTPDPSGVSATEGDHGQRPMDKVLASSF